MDAVSQNLSALRQKSILLSEKRLAHIDEGARALAQMIESGAAVSENEGFISEYRNRSKSLFPYSPALPTDVPEENRGRVAAELAEEAVNSAIFLSASIVARRKLMGVPLTVTDFFPQPKRDDDERISYLRNPYSDTAYRIFSYVMKNASVSYSSDFSGVCEEVYYGRCKYCILPVETSDEGALSRFRKLISKYELCPVLSCSVSSGGGSQTTGFSLFSKNIERIGINEIGGVIKQREIFSFRLNAPDEITISKTFKALHLYGLRLLKADSVPVAWDEGRYSFELSAECGEGDLSAMLLYLLLEIPEYSPIGLYSQIELKR